eukprot:12276-Heterococcus_DN1.PRE.3
MVAQQLLRKGLFAATSGLSVLLGKQLTSTQHSLQQAFGGHSKLVRALMAATTELTDATLTSIIDALSSKALQKSTTGSVI